MEKPLMTLADCAKVFRSLGVHISAREICNRIESGAYPFGVIISVGKTGRRSTVIYRAKLKSWILENLGLDITEGGAN